MKKLLLVAALVMLAAPVLAQTNTLGVYADPAGTALNLTTGEEYYNVYVILFAENQIGGAAFMLDVTGNQNIIFQNFGDGIVIGESAPVDVRTGVQIAYEDPVLGFFGTPVLLVTLTMQSTVEEGGFAEMCVLPYPEYEDVVYAHPAGELFPVTGLCGTVSVPVPGETTTWGNMKALFN